MAIEFRIDWLSVTVHASITYAESIWRDFFQEHLGDLQDTGHGGRGFKVLQFAELGAKMYTIPTGDGAYFHIELPGKACACIPPDTFRALMQYLETKEKVEITKFKVKRLDFAFDHVPFTPEMFEQAIQENRVRSLTQRESLKVIDSPFRRREDESGIGCKTVYFGSPSSTRKVRVYNKRGPVRLELELRDIRADYVARVVLTHEKDWLTAAIAHVRDFIDIYVDEERTALAGWWQEFIDDVSRAYATVYSSKEISKERIKAWFENQVAVWLFVLKTIEPEFLEKIAAEAPERLKPHHELLL